MGPTPRPPAGAGGFARHARIPVTSCAAKKIPPSATIGKGCQPKAKVRAAAPTPQSPREQSVISPRRAFRLPQVSLGGRTRHVRRKPAVTNIPPGDGVERISEVTDLAR